jgi:aryl-alcohol dehydrogenase
MKTMKAAVLRGHDQPHCIGDVTLGKPEPGEALVRTVGVGMCHTDMRPDLSPRTFSGRSS